jgi:phosphatidylinositol phospholipase C delta
MGAYDVLISYIVGYVWSWKWLNRFTKTNLGRMYPFGLRFDSSNADPMSAWKHGLQVAAVNVQGRDRAVWLSQAFFSNNGGCGYVKKPDFLLPGSNVDSTSLQPKLELKVSLPYSPPDSSLLV